MTNVTSLPGVKPRQFSNESAIELLQETIRQMQDGEVVGIGLVTVKPNCKVNCYWDGPTNMGEFIYYGACKLSYTMMRDSNG